MDRDWLAVFEALKAVYTEGAYSNIAVNEAVSRHSVSRESFVRTFAKGVIRDSIRLDYIIDRLAARGIKSIKQRPLIVLRMGIFAIDSLDSVPAHAAVSEAVELSKRVAKGSDRFVNGMLRTYIRNASEFDPEKMEPRIRYSFSKSIYGLLEEQYGAEAENLAEALCSPPPLYLRVNSLKTDRDEVIRLLTEEGFDAEPSEENSEAVIAYGSGIASDRLFREGYYSIQNISSMTAVKAFSPESGSRVLDLCAAPGGKTGYMAELMHDIGSITACDIHRHRLSLIEAAMKRTGVSIVNTRECDASVFDPFLEGKFDYVLADVPCSGLGVIATKPEIKLNEDISGYDELIKTQKSILRNAIRYAKPGGRVMYSTCTLNKKENEILAEDILSKEGAGARIVEMQTLLPYNGNGKVGFFYCIIGKNAINQDGE